MKLLKILMVIGFISNLFGCGQKNNKLENNGALDETKITKPVQNISATSDQVSRRERSEKICIEKGIPVYKNKNSLFVESEEKVEIRSLDEIVDRALALCYLGLKSEGLEQSNLDKMDEAWQISSKLTPIEKLYADSKSPTQQQTTNANWRYESLHVLLWSLGYIDDLVFPDKLCNVADDVTIIYELGAKKFKDQAKLRSKKEILDNADLILRYNWSCVSARVKGEAPPAGLNASVIYERHYSLNWLINNLGQKWDNITTDT